MNKAFLAGFVIIALFSVAIFSSVSKLSTTPTGQVIQEANVGQLREVLITNDGFEPEVLFARKGDRIRFTNNAQGPETVTSEVFGSPLLFPQDRYEFILREENGTIRYKSLSNSNFKGEIRILGG